mmetsp:Transcript_1157/g.2656  ORF Transcript_1157/g.2656 Transcript_1157/m.2656 type:complete len:140 (+) Transcript_1157:882-1301(+)
MELTQPSTSSFLSLLTILKEVTPRARRNRTRSWSSEGPLKKSSTRPSSEWEVDIAIDNKRDPFVSKGNVVLNGVTSGRRRKDDNSLRKYLTIVYCTFTVQSMIPTTRHWWMGLQAEKLPVPVSCIGDAYRSRKNGCYDQ